MISTSDLKEDESFSILKGFLRQENILTIFCKKIDYGIDGQIEILTLPPSENFYKENETIPGDLRRILDIQVKSTSNLKRNKDGSVSFPFKIKHLKLWLDSPRPVIIFRIDLKNKEIYWSYVDKAIKIKTQNKSKKQSLKLYKLEQNCWNVFDSLVSNFYTHAGTKPLMSTAIVLPMFKDFIQRRERGVELRKELIFQDLNPEIDSEGVMRSTKPKTGIRSYIPIEEYGISTNQYYKPSDPFLWENINESITEKRVILSVFEGEILKIVWDLASLCGKPKVIDFIQIINNLDSLISQYEQPIIFINENVTSLLDWKDSELNPIIREWYARRKRDAVNNCYLRSRYNQKKMLVYFFYVTKKFEGEVPGLRNTKVIIIDGKNVQYITKEPLRMEWKTIAKPASVRYIETQEIKEEWGYFDFMCYTIGEVRYSGEISVYHFSQEEERRKKIGSLKI